MLILFFFILSIAALVFKRKGLALFLFFVFSSGLSGFFTENIAIGGGALRFTDLSLLFLFFVLTVQLINDKFKINFKGESKWQMVAFLLVMALYIFVDIYFTGTSTNDVFRVTRTWLLLLFAFAIPYFDRNDIEDAMKWLYYLTMIHLVVFAFQPVLGYNLGGLVSSYGGIMRYYNLPFFWLFAFWYTYFKINVGNKAKALIMTFFIVCLLISITRSILFSIFACMLFAFLLFEKRANSLWKSLLFAAVGVAVLLLIPNVRVRVLEGVDEISIIGDIDSIFATLKESPDMNFIFRVAHLVERFLFVLEDAKKTIFGLGFISEDSLSYDYFLIGLRDDSGHIVQLDTADNSWSNLLIRFGIVGTVLFVLWLFYSFIKPFLRAKTTTWGRVGLMYIVSSLLLSTSSSNLYMPIMYIPLIFILEIARRETSDKC